MAPVAQYVFAEMLGISEHFTAGSHEWLPYSVIPTFLKTDLQTTICRHSNSRVGIDMKRNRAGAVPRHDLVWNYRRRERALRMRWTVRS